jgi:hypothetical protein
MCYHGKISNMYNVFSLIKITAHLLNNHMNTMNTLDSKCLGLLTESGAWQVMTLTNHCNTYMTLDSIGNRIDTYQNHC